jgi:hypothetical protein
MQNKKGADILRALFVFGDMRSLNLRGSPQNRLRLPGYVVRRRPGAQRLATHRRAPASTRDQKEYFTVTRVVIPESTISDSARLLFPTCDQYE